MHRGVKGQIRKTAAGRYLLFHINTGLFWIYGLLTFLLTFLVSSFWFQSVSTRVLLSVPFALLAAFTLARLVHALFWKRFRNVRMHNYVIWFFLAANILILYALDVRDGSDGALLRLGSRALCAVSAGVFSYRYSRNIGA